MINESRPYATPPGKRRITPVLKILLVIAALLAFIGLAFDVHPPLEITGLLLFVLLFLIITEMAGWKSHPSRDFRETVACPPGQPARKNSDNIADGLPESCAVFQDIDTGYGKIDYIILSRENGLFIVERKQHPGKITLTDSSLTINGVAPEQDFFVKILWYTFWLNEKVKTITNLDTVVTPMVVFTNASVEVSEPVKNVVITDVNNILRNIQKTKTDPQTAASLWAIYQSGAVMW